MRWTKEQLRDYEARRLSRSAKPEQTVRDESVAGKPWTKLEDDQLRAYYCMTPDQYFSIEKIASHLNRSPSAVALRASRIGVTGKRTDSTQFTQEHRDNISKAQIERASSPDEKKHRSDVVKRWHRDNPHPRGMRGKHHTEETKEKIRSAHIGKSVPRERVERQMKTRLERYGTLSPRVNRGTSWKAGWVVVGGQRFYARSLWEANYARYLQWQKERHEIQDWEHEPTTFWFKGIKRGCVSYLPDFKVTTWIGDVEYHEVKGWMDASSRTKIKRMAKYHPLVKLIVIDSARYKALQGMCRNIVPGWVTKSKHITLEVRQEKSDRPRTEITIE